MLLLYWLLLLSFDIFKVSAAPILQPNAEATAITLIKQTINLFPVLVDSHVFNQFDQVFAPNATADLKSPDGAIFRGVSEISAALSGLQNVSSQHGFTTQFVTVTSSSTANATAYLFANFFGQGDKEGQIFTEYGKCVPFKQ